TDESMRLRSALDQATPAQALLMQKSVTNPQEVPYAAKLALLLVNRVVGVIPLIETTLWRHLWSLAQHYEIRTAILDVTRDPLVAGWFATNPWNEHEKRPSQGAGVIYRFDAEKLDRAFHMYNLTAFVQAVLNRVTPALPPFLADISDIPPAMALRPSRQ